MRKEKRSEIIHDAMQYLDDEMIEQVREIRTKNTKKAYWRRGITIAASISLFLVGGWVWNNVLAPSADRFGVDNGTGEKENQSDSFAGDLESVKEGVVLPPLQIDLGKPEREDVAADMIGLFIYQGRCYVQTTDYFEDNLDFLGTKLGTATGYIDEWTPKDGYVEFAGTVTGDFYEVKGVEPEFMLAILHEWDDEQMAELYVNNNGITLYKGADVVEKYLHLKENYKEVSCLSYEQLMDAWSVGASVDMKTKKISKKQHDLVDEFIDAYSKGEFVKDNFNGGDGNNDHVYHLYFTLDSGVRLHFTLAGDGYVYFEGLYGVCVKVDIDIYDAMVKTLEEASKK